MRKGVNFKVLEASLNLRKKRMNGFLLQNVPFRLEDVTKYSVA